MEDSMKRALRPYEGEALPLEPAHRLVSGSLGERDAAAQRSSYARGIAASLFGSMKDEGFMERVRFRAEWKAEKDELERQMRAHRKDMPSFCSAVRLAREIVNAAGGDLDGRDDPWDTIS